MDVLHAVCPFLFVVMDALLAGWTFFETKKDTMHARCPILFSVTVLSAFAILISGEMDHAIEELGHGSVAKTVKIAGLFGNSKYLTIFFDQIRGKNDLIKNNKLLQQHHFMLSTKVKESLFCNLRLSKQSISHIAQTFSQQKFGGVNFSSYLCSAKNKGIVFLVCAIVNITQPLNFHIQF